MHINVFTLNWNGKDKLQTLYPTLINSLSDLNYTWFVKDNGSKDDSVSYLNSLNDDKIKCIAYKNNLQNFATGMNYLFAEAAPNDEDLIVLLNNDVIFNDSNSLKYMMSIINNDPNVGVVGARLLYTGTKKIQHAGVVIDNKHKMPMHYRAHQEIDKDSEKNREFQSVTAAVVLTKAKYFKNICTTNKSGINGMDENFHWAFEDVSMCLSIKYNMNKKIVYCGNTNIYHEESASLKKVPSNKLFMPHNTNYFLKLWADRYTLDHDAYKNNSKYQLYEK